VRVISYFKNNNNNNNNAPPSLVSEWSEWYKPNDICGIRKRTRQSELISHADEYKAVETDQCGE